MSKDSIKAINGAFKDVRIGCIAGKPVSIDSRNTKYGYWSHLLFAGINKVRKRLSNEKSFLNVQDIFLQ